MIEKTLELLARAQDYEITKSLNGEGYRIECHDYDLMAYMDEDSIEFYVTGVYNSGLDCAEINMNALKELYEFCQFLRGECEEK